jgi:hypothetical protein
MLTTTRAGNGNHTFSTFTNDYVLIYTPLQQRGRYVYTLKRAHDDAPEIAQFTTLSEARKWVSMVGFERLDRLTDRLV